MFLKIILKSYKVNFTCLASSKQTSGPFLYLGCLTISQGFGPSSVSLVKEHDFFLFLYHIHYQYEYAGFTSVGQEKFYANSDSAEININSHSALFKLKKTKPAFQIKCKQITLP